MWSTWNTWTKCTKDCKKYGETSGEKYRTRQCNNPAPSPNGDNCIGKKSQKESCNEQQCKGKIQK